MLKNLTRWILLFCLPLTFTPCAQAKAKEGKKNATPAANNTNTIYSERSLYPQEQNLIKQINDIAVMQEKIQHDLLSIQDNLVEENKDAIATLIDFTLPKITNSNKQDLVLTSLQVELNDYKLAQYNTFDSTNAENIIPLYKGPLARGKYKLKIEAIFGILTQNYPYIIPQGKWSINKNFTFTLSEKDTTPQIHLNIVKQNLDYNFAISTNLDNAQ